MDLTPNEIRNQKFGSAMRGYKRDEVDTFLETAAAALEEVKVSLLKASEEKAALTMRLEEMHNLEETIKAAVIEAQRGAEATLANARLEADSIIAEARRYRDEAIEQKQRRLAQMEARLEEIDYTRKSLFARIHADLSVFARILETIDPNRPEGEKKEAPRINNPETDIDRIVEQFRIETGMNEEKRDG